MVDSPWPDAPNCLAIKQSPVIMKSLMIKQSGDPRR